MMKNRCSRATFKKNKEKNWSPATSNINLIKFSEKKLLVLRKRNNSEFSEEDLYLNSLYTEMLTAK